MTPEELQRILDADPDKAIVAVENGVTVLRNTLISGAQRRLDSTVGSDLVSQSTNGTESPLERQFSNLWQMLGGPELEREHRFEPMRRWRADFAHLASRTLIQT